MTKTKKPNKCDKCGSKRIIVSWCEGVKTRNGRLLTGIQGKCGFVCTTIGEHFHYYCKECGYVEKGS